MFRDLSLIDYSSQWFTKHAMQWIEQEPTLEEIDSAVKFKLGFPMGIFELADFTGMDVIHKATTEMHLTRQKSNFATSNN